MRPTSLQVYATKEERRAVPNAIDVKICGLTTVETVKTAVDAGAAYAGFVFFEKSPRAISIDDALAVMEPARGRIKTVALTVNADTALLDEIAQTLKPDFIQFHGAETADALSTARSDYGCGIIKACGVSTRDDLQSALIFRDVADMILLDAKPPKSADRPGGHGAPFDWSILDDWPADVPILLAGGLNPNNVANAIERTVVTAVDVSSGVESAPGLKDPALIRAFIKNAQTAREGVAA